MPAVAYVSDRSAVEVHDSLRSSLAAADEAQQCAVLWFAEVKRRQLYRELGYSSIYQYAMQGLDFSRSRARDFIRLAKKLDELPAVRAAVAEGKLGYTKAREVVDVATPETEDRWLEVAEGPRGNLVDEVKKVKRAARVDPSQGELLPSEPLVVAPRELPVRFQVELTPEQEVRRSALVERLHKLGGVPSDRAELLLEALAALVDERESDNTDSHAEKGPRGPNINRPPVQIHVHEEAATGRMTVQTDAGERELGRADAERMHCDAAVSHPGHRNTTTIPPRTRREVLARDHHRCQAPGCGRTRFLEVHHLTPRQHGGSNHAENLTTLCGACHRLWHERGRGAATTSRNDPAADGQHVPQ